jgi:hypothetical protein
VPIPAATDIDMPDLPDLEDDVVDEDPCLDDPSCEMGTGAVAGQGVAPVVAGRGYGGGLPYTGIEDFVAPIFIAIMALVGGVAVWRNAGFQERVRAARDYARRYDRETQTGYAYALENIDADAEIAAFLAASDARRASA